MSSIWERTKHEIFEESEETPATPAKPTPIVKPDTGFAMAAVHEAAGSSVPTSTNGDQFYQRLVAKTNPENLPNLSKIMTLAKPLEGIIQDASLRMKAAFAQASVSGVTTESVMQDIATLFTELDAEVKQYNYFADQKTQEIAKKEQQLKDLSIDVAQSKAHLDEAIAGFTSAHSRRQNDLNALKNQFSNLK